MKKALDRRIDRSVNTESLTKLADIVHNNNFFKHDSKVFQKQETAVGTKFASSHTILFIMGDYEKQALDSYHLKTWVWWRYINDIF